MLLKQDIISESWKSEQKKTAKMKMVPDKLKHKTKEISQNIHITKTYKTVKH